MIYELFIAINFWKTAILNNIYIDFNNISYDKCYKYSSYGVENYSTALQEREEKLEGLIGFSLNISLVQFNQKI